MGVTAFGLENYVKDAVITANSTAATGLDPDNVANDYGSPQFAWQTAAGVLTNAGGALIRMDPRTPGQTWRYIALAGVNYTEDAAVNIALWSVATGLVWATSVAGPPAGYGQIVVVVPTDTVADFLQIYIDDPTNPDNHLNTPLIAAGPLWIPTWGAGLRTTFGRRHRTDKQVSIGGTEYNTPRWQQRWLRLGFDGTSATTELWQYAMELDQIARLGGNILAIPDINSTNINYEAVFGVMEPGDGMSHGLGVKDVVSWDATISERL